jgi:uncharacterized protein YuzE
MEKTPLKQNFVRQLFNISSDLTKMPSKRYWVDYDDEADVLYISFERPQKATDSRMLDNGLLIRYQGKKVIGITILDASKRSNSTPIIAKRRINNSRNQ